MLTLLMMILQLKKNYGTRIRSPCIFGMCCKNVNVVDVGRFFEVEKIDKATLLPIIQNEVELRSIIYSDQWRAYSTLILKRYRLSS
jgi:hypothetical protein